jgi:hypothetical protein
MYAPYVATLFRFLETRGISQADVARRLGLQRTSTNLWAKGSRPISRIHAWRFATLVHEQLVLMCEEGHWLEASEVVGPWDHELAFENGLMDDQAQTAVRLVSELILLQPSRLMTAQLQDYHRSARQLVSALGGLMRRRGEPPSGESERTWFSTDDPRDRHKELWLFCNIDLEKPDTSGRDHHAA